MPISTQASVTRRRPDWTRNSTSRRLNSCLLIDNTATAHLPGPQNPGVCHLYLAEGCHLYIALTASFSSFSALRCATRNRATARVLVRVLRLYRAVVAVDLCDA